MKFSFPPWAQLAATTFGGAALGFLEQTITAHGIPPETDWLRIVLVAVGVGTTAVIHRYLPVPGGST